MVQYLIRVFAKYFAAYQFLLDRGKGDHTESEFRSQKLNFSLNLIIMHRSEQFRRVLYNLIKTLLRQIGHDLFRRIFEEQLQSADVVFDKSNQFTSDEVVVHIVKQSQVLPNHIDSSLTKFLSKVLKVVHDHLNAVTEQLRFEGAGQRPFTL